MYFVRKSGLLIITLFCVNLSLVFTFVADYSDSLSVSSSANHHQRKSRAEEIFLSDSLDCLSQLVCGLNTFPPNVPTPRTSSANDYAYLLQHVILRLKKQKISPTQSPITTTSTTTTTAKPVNDEQNDNDDDYQEDDADSEEDEDTTAERHKKKVLKNSKDQHGDVVEMKGLYPPLGIFDFIREARAIRSKPRINAKKKGRDDKKSKKSKNKKQAALRITTTTAKPLTKLELLKREQDIRTKLRSNAKCMYGILDHTCPFKYSELLILMSGVLERQKVMSHSTNKILPMVGYLLKSRSLTQTMKATFFALERINNITLVKNHNHEPFGFSHIYDEIVRGELGGNGLHIVETKLDAPASSHIWEDDEFDAALSNPFLPREKIPGYAIKDRSKNKNKETQNEESAENSGEEEDEVIAGIIPPPNADPFTIGHLAGFLNKPEEEPTEYYDENESDNGAESAEDVPLPPVYGVVEPTPKRQRKY